MQNKRERIFLLAIFCLALCLRCAYDIFLRQNYFFYDTPSDDVLYYQDWAKEIAEGNWLGNKVFYGMPLYPYFLAVLERLTMGSGVLIRLAHFFLGSLNCVLIYFIAKKIFSARVGYLASVLAASNFILIYYDWLMMPVTLIITLSLLLILALIHLDESSKKSDWFILGILLGLSIFPDGKFLAFFVFAVFYLVFFYRKIFPTALKRIFLPFILGTFLMLSCVMLRNKIVEGDWIFISAHGGINFYLGNNPKADGTFANPSFLRPEHGGHIDDPRIIAETALKRNLKPSEVSGFWSQKALDFIYSSPVKYAQLLNKKFVLFFTDAQPANDLDLVFQQDWKNKFDVNPLRLIWPLALIGIVFTFRNRNNGIRYINLLLLAQFIFTLVFFLITRHRATILPFLLIFEAYAIFWLIDRLRAHDFKSVSAMGLSLVILFIIFRPQFLAPEFISFLKFAKAGPIFAEQKNFKRAQECYKKALEIEPLDDNSLYNSGTAYTMEGNFQRALTRFKQALLVNPSNTDVLYNLAYAHEQLGNPSAALESYQKVISLQPSSPDAHFRIAGIYQAEGNCPAAISHYQEVVKIAPQFAHEVNQCISRCQP